jgi:hypothetical protein
LAQISGLASAGPVISTTNAFLAGGNLQDEREERAALSLDIDKFD